MIYKDYYIEEIPNEYRVYKDYNAWRDNEPHIRTFSSIEEAQRWIDGGAEPSVEISGVEEHDGYYIELIKRKGLLGREKVGRVGSSQDAIIKLRESPPGNYTTKTYWDGELFSVEGFKVTDHGEVLVSTPDGWMKVDSWKEYTDDYVYPSATMFNEFYSEEERDAAEKRVKSYIKEHRR